MLFERYLVAFGVKIGLQEGLFGNGFQITVKWAGQKIIDLLHKTNLLKLLSKLFTAKILKQVCYFFVISHIPTFFLPKLENGQRINYSVFSLSKHQLLCWLHTIL